MLMRIPALCQVLKADWEESKHPRADNGQFGSGSGSSSAKKPRAGSSGQRSLSSFEGKPQNQPHSKPTAPKIDIQAKRTSSGIKYSAGDSTLYTSKDGKGDRVISGIRFSKDPKTTAAVIERALKDGAIAIPDNIANSPGCSKALAELQKEGKITLNTDLKEGHTIIKPGNGKLSEPRPAPKPAPKPEPKPEAKPEPKPEPQQETKPDPNPESKKPEDGEVSVTSSKGWAAYKLGEHIHISIAIVQGGGRTVMGSKIAPQASADDVAVVMYRAVKDGPVTFPDSMFANTQFRQAIQSLEKLEKIQVNDSSNGRDKVLYELGPDGYPKGPLPQPGQKPAQSPRRHPVNTDAKVLPKFTPAKTSAEALSRLTQHMPAGAKVDYEGVPVEKMNSLLKASEHVLGKYGVEVRSMGFCTKHSDNYGVCASDYGKNVLYVQVRKSFISNPEKYIKRDIGRMRGNQAYNIIRKEKYIQDLKTKGTYRGDVESEIKNQEKKLEHIKSVDHWIVADAVEDPLYAVQAHECMHAVYFYHNLSPKFTEEMNKVHGWDIPLTEYATTKKSEFFAELGSAITCGMEVHPKLFEAFQNTVRSIQ